MDTGEVVSGPFRFAVTHRCEDARAGHMITAHGQIQTPAFMPVGTQGMVKALGPVELERTGARLFIANTYHLWLRPGAEAIAAHGGLHGFNRWPYSIATDSGGFQAFSLADRTKLSERGFEFASHLDGSRKLLTPEVSMQVQGLLGSDIAMQLDVCSPAGSSLPVLREAVSRTTRWAERCLEARRKDQAVFGIIQGGTDVDLRLEHAEALGRLPLDGLALGGFSVGEPPKEMHRALESIVRYVDPARPRYLMGVGTPEDLLRGIGSGVDLFDCVLPSRNARNGQAFVRSGKLVIKHARYRDDREVLQPGCECHTCASGYSRAYLRHLFVSREIMASRLITEHNVHFFQTLVREARIAILAREYPEFLASRLSELGVTEPSGTAAERGS